MKKLIIFIFLVVPLVGFAQFYKAKVTMNDGSIKNGFVHLPDYPDDAKIKFRLEERGKNEKLDVNDVKEFEIINDKNETVKYATVYLADPKPFTRDQFTLGKKKSWVKILKEGGITIYYAYAAYSPGTGTGGFGSSYIMKKNDTHAYFIMDGGSKGLNFNMNGYQVFKKYFAKIFEKDCPKLIELVTKEDLNKNGIRYLVDLFDNNCAK
jgi:hypothetical protein